MCEAKILKIRKRDGRIVPFRPEKISNAIHKAIMAVGEKDEEVAKELSHEVVALLEEKFAVPTAKPAGQIPSVENIQDIVEDVLIRRGYARVAKAFILYRQKRAEIRAAKKFFGVEDELKLTVNATRVLERRYLLKDEEGKVIETPAQMIRRVAKAIASVDLLYDEKADVGKTEEEFHRTMSNLEFLPNSPTLMNAGTDLGQLSACFVLPVGDSIEEIFNAVKYMAVIHKSGGGTGFDFSKLRPKGDIVKSTKGIASGPLSFMRVFDVTTNVIKQGGCLASDTFIRTTRGLIPMGELLDCRHLGENPTRTLVYTNGGFWHADQALDNSWDDCLKVETDIGLTISATPDEQIQIVNEKGDFAWKKVRDLKKGDWLPVVLGGFLGEDVTLPPLEYKQHPNATLLTLPSTMCPELAEVVGYYMADGCLSTACGRDIPPEMKGRLALSIADSTPDLIQHFTKLIEKLFGLDAFIQRKRGERDASCSLVVSSRDLTQWWQRVGFEKKRAENAFIPQSILSSSEESACAFLRGLFEGGGGIHTDGYPRLSTTSARLVMEAQQLLLALGIVSKVSRRDYRKSSLGISPIFELVIVNEPSRKRFIEKIGFISQLKQKTLELRQKPKEYGRSDPIPNQSERLRKLYAGPGRGSGPGRSKRGANRELYRLIRHYMSGVKNTRQLSRSRLKELMARFPELNDPELRRIADDKYYYVQVKSLSKTRLPTMEISVYGMEHFVANGFLIHNRRRGANMGILSVNHPDILEFITAKTKENFLTNFNLSVAVTDEFMNAVKDDREYPLINPRTGKEVKRLKARSIFDLITTMAWRTGDPGMIFIDEINRRNPTPHIGKIESTNPCAEQPLLPGESCNLGSINLSKMVKNREVDWEKLERTVEIAVHFLDNVIDANKFPLPEIEKITKGNRKIGLGVMGFADFLIKLGIPYDSEEGLKIAEKVMKLIMEKARETSVKLAEKRGLFPNFKGSIYDKPGGLRLRNATLTTIAPTGTISLIAGCSSGIEPLFAISFVRNIMEGTRLLEVNPLFEEMARERGLYSAELAMEVAKKGTLRDLKGIPEDMRRIFVTAFDISPEWHVRMQAAFQRYTDNAVSKTINFPPDATVEDVKKAYLLAHELRCKGITVYRYGSKKEQVLYIGGILGKERGETLEYVSADSEYAGGCPEPYCPF
ncbi:MAG: adenosylcobalamin-dependent ribonucleoside-diphosphate reductase [Actinomycetota bacterium]